MMQREVHSRVRKTDDVEIHVSTVSSDSGTFADIREYIVSLEQYGRGVTFAPDLRESVLDGLFRSQGAPDAS